MIKNVAGYDLAKLFAGAYGTLGAILQVAVRLHPLAPATVTAVGRGDDPRAVAAAALGAEPRPAGAGVPGRALGGRRRGRAGPLGRRRGRRGRRARRGAAGEPRAGDLGRGRRRGPVGRPARRAALGGRTRVAGVGPSGPDCRCCSSWPASWTRAWSAARPSACPGSRCPRPAHAERVARSALVPVPLRRAGRPRRPGRLGPARPGRAGAGRAGARALRSRRGVRPGADLDGGA